MENSFFNLRFLFCKSVLIAVLLHWAVFNNFILTFPTRTSAHKPKLIFLGSILQSSDMENILPQDGRALNKTDRLTNLNKIQESSGLYQGGIDKPAPYHSHDPKNKKTLKTLQKVEPENRQAQEPVSLDDMSLEKGIQPYKPLRLKDHD